MRLKDQEQLVPCQLKYVIYEANLGKSLILIPFIYKGEE